MADLLGTRQEPPVCRVVQRQPSFGDHLRTNGATSVFVTLPARTRHRVPGQAGLEVPEPEGELYYPWPSSTRTTTRVTPSLSSARQSAPSC
jgi:hypothetical protein